MTSTATGPRTWTATSDYQEHTPWIAPDTTDTYDDERDIDWIAVELACNGQLSDPSSLNQAEREEAWRLMLAHGLSYAAAGRRTGVHWRHVSQWAKTEEAATEAGCDIDGCPQPVEARGWCHNHYYRWLRHGDPLGGRHSTRGCAVADCPMPHRASGFCAVHYDRWQRTGSPLPDLPLPVTIRRCDADGCTEPHYGLGWCLLHYTRWIRHGTLDRPGRIADWAAVEQAVSGPSPPQHLTPAAREQAVRILHRRRLNDQQIAAHVGITGSGVLRIRRRLGLPAVDTRVLANH